MEDWENLQKQSRLDGLPFSAGLRRGDCTMVSLLIGLHATCEVFSLDFSKFNNGFSLDICGKNKLSEQPPSISTSWKWALILRESQGGVLLSPSGFKLGTVSTDFIQCGQQQFIKCHSKMILIYFRMLLHRRFFLYLFCAPPQPRIVHD